MTGFRGFRLDLFLAHRLFGFHVRQRQQRRQRLLSASKSHPSLILFPPPFLPLPSTPSAHPQPLCCARRYSAVVCKSSDATSSQSTHRKCHPPTLYVRQSLDYTHGGRLNALLPGLRSEESLSLLVTVSLPQSLGGHILNLSYRCLWQDLPTVFVCPWRVSQRICESPPPTPLAPTHSLRSNPVSTHPVPHHQIILNPHERSYF